jgi:SAM-dependent methyltransferase
MKRFEWIYLCLEPVMPPLHQLVRKNLKDIVSRFPGNPEILDVGGRKSHYTIGLPARITISDLPRESDLQKELNLGINQEIIGQTLRRRSNVTKIIVDDMCKSRLPDGSVDGVVAVEVLEHVEDDLQFIQQIHRVLRPGGVFFMTTPNADHPGRAKLARNPGGDTKRFYTRKELEALLGTCFPNVEVHYAVTVGRWHSLGIRSWSLRRPVQTLVTMFSNAVNNVKSSRVEVKSQAIGTRELVATAKKGA